MHCAKCVAILIAKVVGTHRLSVDRCLSPSSERRIRPMFMVSLISGCFSLTHNMLVRSSAQIVSCQASSLFL